MKEITELLSIVDRLLGPNGCPWDQKQTFYTLQTYLLEEVYELVEAIDSKSTKQIVEELGDVLFTLIFIARQGEKEHIFTLQETLQCVCEKLIRRHPHIFADVKIESVGDIIQNWEKIKKEEKKERQTIFDGIPLMMPELMRAQKMIERMQRQTKERLPGHSTEDEIGHKLWEIVDEANRSGIDAESALRRHIRKIEKNTGE